MLGGMKWFAAGRLLTQMISIILPSTTRSFLKRGCIHVNLSISIFHVIHLHE